MTPPPREPLPQGPVPFQPHPTHHQPQWLHHHFLTAQAETFSDPPTPDLPPYPEASELNRGPAYSMEPRVSSMTALASPQGLKQGLEGPRGTPHI